MQRRIAKRLSALAVAVACLGLSAGLWAKEEFQARILKAGGADADAARKIIISIESYSTTEEIKQLKETLYNGGYEPFMRAFRGISKGYIRPVGGRGVKVTIHAAHSHQTEKGRQILIFCERQSWDVQAMKSFDRRFSFMVIELNINKKGNGDGKFFEQANIRFTIQDTVEIEGYNSPPQQLFGVSLLK